MARWIFCGFRFRIKIKQVRNYIKNQNTHHQKKTFDEEYQYFMEKYNFE